MSPSSINNRRKSELKLDIESITEGRSEVNVMCFDLVYFTRPAQFVILATGVFFFYFLYGYFQEIVFSLPGFSSYGWYLTLIQFAYYSVFGKIEMVLRRGKRKVPLKTYSVLALATVITMGFSNASLGYLNYPTQTFLR
jgi:adenosine 3'-phospho 5'-phosphosulfate transporter B3